jgi:hypothetical protein
LTFYYATLVKKSVTSEGTSDEELQYSNSGKLSGNINSRVPPKYLENGCNGELVVVLGITAGRETPPVLKINRAAFTVAPITEAPLIA